MQSHKPVLGAQHTRRNHEVEVVVHSFRDLAEARIFLTVLLCSSFADASRLLENLEILQKIFSVSFRHVISGADSRASAQKRDPCCLLAGELHAVLCISEALEGWASFFGLAGKVRVSFHVCTSSS